MGSGAGGQGSGGGDAMGMLMKMLQPPGMGGGKGGQGAQGNATQPAQIPGPIPMQQEPDRMAFLRAFNLT